MKKIFTLLILIISINLSAQEWAPVGAVWHYSQQTINPDLKSFSTFESISDTTIIGVQCKKIIETNRAYNPSGTEYVHYMYSKNDSVFFLKEGSFHLLYDFGALEGDTIVLNYFWTVNGDPLLMIIDSTSTIDVNGETRIIQYITCGDGIVVGFGTKVIEGIGNTYHMFPTYDGEFKGPLRCYEDSMVGLYLSPYHPYYWWNFEDCEEIITGIKEVEINIRLSAYPNPFTTFTTIEYELDGKSQIQISIYNTMGEVVYEAGERIMPPGSHKFTWSPGQLPAGLYYAVLRSEDGVSIVKVVKQ